MVESAAHLVDHMFPEAPVRQWVLTFPFPLHFLFAAHPVALPQLLETLSWRIVRLLERRGLLIADPECPALDFKVSSSLDQLQAASVNYRIAIGPHARRKALTLCSVPPMEERSNIPLLAKVAGFTLHAATVCEANQRSRLERLCRYIALQGCRVLDALGQLRLHPPAHCHQALVHR
jgi:hypothetical protein